MLSNPSSHTVNWKVGGTVYQCIRINDVNRNCQHLDPPYFSLPTTFKTLSEIIKEICVSAHDNKIGWVVTFLG